MNEYVEKFSKITDKFLAEFEFNPRKIRYYLLLFYVFSAPLVIYLENSEYGYTKLIYTFVYISALFLFWMGELVTKEKGESIEVTRLALPLVGIILSGLLSGINAPSLGVVFQSLGVIIYFYLIYLLVVNTVRTEEEKHYFLFALILSAAVAAIYGLLQYFGLTPGAFGQVPGKASIISTLGNRNFLGGFLAYMFVPALGLLFVVRNDVTRYITMLTLGLFFFLLIPINSIGSWVGLISGFLVFVFSILIYRPTGLLKGKKLLVILLVLTLLAAYLFASTPGPLNSLLGFSASERNPEKWGLATPLVEPFYKLLIEKGGPRIQDWKISLEMLKSHPILGIGLGNFKIKFLEYRRKFLQTEAGQQFKGYIPRGVRAHNEYLQVAAELGLFGLIVVLTSLVFILWSIIKVMKRADRPSKRILTLALFGGVVSFLVHSGLSFPAHLPASSLAFVSFLGIIHSCDLREGGMNLTISRYKRYVVAGLVVLFILSVSVLAIRDWRANILRTDGKRQFGVGNYRVAREKFMRSLALDFYPRQTYYYLGAVDFKLGRLKSAEEFFEKSLGRFEPYELFLRLALVNMKQGELSKAETYLKKLLATSPKESLRIQGNYHLSRIYFERKNYKASVRILEKILKQIPNFSDAIFLRGAIAYSRGNLKTAEKKWKKVLQLSEKELTRVREKLAGKLTLKKRKELRDKKKKLQKRVEALKERLEKL